MPYSQGIGQEIQAPNCLLDAQACDHSVSFFHHCSLPFKQPVKDFEGDGLEIRAGDGARTPDSLLGRKRLRYRRSPDIHLHYSRLHTIHLQCERARQNGSRAFADDAGQKTLRELTAGGHTTERHYT